MVLNLHILQVAFNSDFPGKHCYIKTVSSNWVTNGDHFFKHHYWQIFLVSLGTHWLQSKMWCLEVDLCSSHLTRQFTHNYSWRADPEAMATDAFMQDWSQQQGFASPPWCLIHRCLSKVKMQLARVVLITPFWKTQSWFPILLELLEGYSLILPTLSDLLVMPTQQELLMKQGVSQMIAWPMSGNPILHKDFLHILQASCSPPGETKPTLFC